MYHFLLNRSTCSVNCRTRETNAAPCKPGWTAAGFSCPKHPCWSAWNAARCFLPRMQCATPSAPTTPRQLASCPTKWWMRYLRRKGGSATGHAVGRLARRRPCPVTMEPTPSELIEQGTFPRVMPAILRFSESSALQSTNKRELINAWKLSHEHNNKCLNCLH